MSGIVRLLFCVASVLACAAPALAQDDPFDPQAGFDAAPASAWQPFGDMRLRADRVRGLPGGRDDLERLRARGRAGLRIDGEGRWSAGVALEAALGTDANGDNIINNDIEASDDINLDQAWLAYEASDHARLQIGKAPLPMLLSPMLWDADLRPTGVAASFGGTRGLTDRWQVQAGWFAPDPLDAGGARVAIVQGAWHWNEGAAWGGGALLTWLRFDAIDTLARAGLGRGNRLAGGAYAEDYEPLDLQLYLRRRDDTWPLLFTLDLVHNPGADTRRHGARASATIGDRRLPGGWEAGWAWERIQRDAVLAAVNDDDWWFHSGMRGHMPWIGYGLDGTWSLRLAGFREVRDAPRETTTRLLLDVEARW